MPQSAHAPQNNPAVSPMSSGDNSEAELVQLAYDDVTGNYCCIAAATWLIFEHAITLTDEIDYIWRRKKTGVAVLFISNRFLGLVLVFSLVMQIPLWSTNPRSEACEELLFIKWAMFSALRVYAVGGQAWCSAAVVFILNFVPFATNLYDDATASYYIAVVPGFGPICVQSSNIVQPKMQMYESYPSFYLATRISVIVADIIVLVVTWTKTYSIKRYANSAHIEAPLATLLLRDGTLHFMLLLLLYLTQLLLNYYEAFAYVSFVIDVFAHLFTHARTHPCSHNIADSHVSSSLVSS
ncbi:hypothetical protein SCP_0806290 [Sparassis crispa]|uniref:DUF6533 domain-containing protein n=1 Tax=Sparassis crispa TaxID=139825 RepID=A0A401GV56_9APHY|nr:hypothetical protein SCP_0806290 [Sparassis crispa]GBE86105.1 hypothetical protein SCP_0806290 [Sparassis crispa]